MLTNGPANLSILWYNYTPQSYGIRWSVHYTTLGGTELLVIYAMLKHCYKWSIENTIPSTVAAIRPHPECCIFLYIRNK